MDRSLLVIFGLPGAGKSYVAEILERQFGYVSKNGDEDLPEPMRHALENKSGITDGMRREFTRNMIASVRKLINGRNRVVLHQTFLKEFMRRMFLREFPGAVFILVETETGIRETRYLQRKYFNLGVDYLRHMSGLFEPPQHTHAVIRNNRDGHGPIVKQLEALQIV